MACGGGAAAGTCGGAAGAEFGSGSEALELLIRAGAERYAKRSA
jgi:hypothetical protein